MIWYALSFCISLILYIYSAYKKRNIINALFFPFLQTGIIMVFLYCISLGSSGNYSELRLGDIYFLLYYNIYFLGCFALEMCRVKAPRHSFRIKTINCVPIIGIVLVLLLYWLINIDVLKEAISNPRMFYANTRIGGGIIYFVIMPLIILVYFYYISKLDYSGKRARKNFVKSILATVLACAVIYMFGQKSAVLSIGLIYLTTFFYKSHSYGRNIKTIFLGVGFAIIFIFIFVLYALQQSIKFTGIISNLVGYSDYLKNFSDLVDNLNNYTYGRTFFQDEIYGYIPRFLWKDKPLLYGSMALGLQVPRLVEWTLSLTGAPSFGPLGQLYADFGLLGIFIKILIQWIFFYIARKYEARLIRDYNVYNHLMFLTFSGVGIFSINMVTIPVYQLIVILILYYISIRFSQKNRKGVLKYANSYKRNNTF